jgi:cytochrome b subunit of formate dehydrogenase
MSKAPAPTDSGKAPARLYERFNVHHLIQHAINAFAFTGLIVTGWPLKFPEVPVSRFLAALVGGPTHIGYIHRGLGVLLIAVSVYHIVYLVWMFLRGQRSLAVLPVFNDAREALGDIAYFFGLREHRPRFGRYNWVEKFEYFAVAWGTLVMALTGLVIWVPSYAALHLPNWVINASVIIHDYEALLAGLAVFLWHFYWVHLHPDVYPMSTVWLNGMLTEAEMEHHHPRELEQIRSTGRATGGEGQP